MPDITASPQPKPQPAATRRAPEAGRPFFGLIDPVLVPSPTQFEFDGAIGRAHAAAAWTWMLRDLAPDLIDPTAEDNDAARESLDAAMPELMQRAKKAMLEAEDNPETERRMRIQFGGDEPYGRLPAVLHALKCRSLLDKAQAYGRAVNAMMDEAQLCLALQSMPLNDQAVYAVLMQAAMGQVANPHRLMAAVVRTVGATTEGAIMRAGYAPLIDAIFSHAQAQIPALQQFGAFADIDLTCRAIERFHKLMRAVTGYVEIGRLSRWATVAGGLTTTVSALIEPRLRDVAPDVNRALRRRDGTDRLDSDLLLSALNGCYVLAAVRESRDSLALNALFDQTWQQVGQALEMHVQRNLELYRANPMDRIVGERLDAAIKMTELRFNTEYADVLRRARESADRRVM